MAVPERSVRYAMPTPIARRTPSAMSVQGDFTPLRTTTSPTGELIAVGIFHPSPTSPAGALSSPVARASPLAPPPSVYMDAEHTAAMSVSASMTSSPMPTAGRTNVHVRFDSGGEARVVPNARAGAWVASSPVGDTTELTLWHAIDEPEEGTAADWGAQEWSAWDMAAYEAWEVEEWDGKWESEWLFAEVGADDAPPTEVMATKLNTHIRFVGTPEATPTLSVFGTDGVLQEARGATPAAHKHEGREAEAEAHAFLEMVGDYEWLPNGKVRCTTTGHEMWPRLIELICHWNGKKYAKLTAEMAKRAEGTLTLEAMCAAAAAAEAAQATAKADAKATAKATAKADAKAVEAASWPSPWTDAAGTPIASPGPILAALEALACTPQLTPKPVAAMTAAEGGAEQTFKAACETYQAATPPLSAVKPSDTRADAATPPAKRAGGKTPKSNLRSISNVFAVVLPPTEAAPIKAAPIEAAPIEAAPIEAAPIEAAPIEAAPVEAAPAEAAPAEAAPVEAAPAEAAPAEAAPIEAAPIEAAPIEAAPAEATAASAVLEEPSMTEVVAETEASLTAMLVAELKELCEQRGLSTVGKKSVLVERLLGSKAAPTAAALETSSQPLETCCVTSSKEEKAIAPEAAEVAAPQTAPRPKRGNKMAPEGATPQQATSTRRSTRLGAA